MSKGELRDEVANLMPHRTQLIKLTLRAKDKSGKKWVESSFPWQEYVTAASDETIDKIVAFIEEREANLIQALGGDK